MTASFVFAIVLSGLWTGALARLAIPGPDPMPIWLTLAIGLAGSIVGAVVGKSISNNNGVVISFLSFGVALALVAARTRERLQQFGLDPNALRPDPAKLERARLEAMLRELHRAGVLTDDELADKLAGLQPSRAEN